MAGIDGFGTKLLRSDMALPGPAVFTAIAGITSITNPEMSRDTYDGTTHDSPNHRREHVGGLVDGGECTVSVNYDPDVHATLRADFDDVAPRNYQIEWPVQAGGGTDEFKAYLTGFSGESPHDGLLTAELTFKVTGDVEYVPAP
jgi:hypothetical protein